MIHGAATPLVPGGPRKRFHFMNRGGAGRGALLTGAQRREGWFSVGVVMMMFVDVLRLNQHRITLGRGRVWTPAHVLRLHHLFALC